MNAERKDLARRLRCQSEVLTGRKSQRQYSLTPAGRPRFLRQQQRLTKSMNRKRSSSTQLTVDQLVAGKDRRQRKLSRRQPERSRGPPSRLSSKLHAPGMLLLSSVGIAGQCHAVARRPMDAPTHIDYRYRVPVMCRMVNGRRMKWTSRYLCAARRTTCGCGRCSRGGRGSLAHESAMTSSPYAAFPVLGRELEVLSCADTGGMSKISFARPYQEWFPFCASCMPRNH